MWRRRFKKKSSGRRTKILLLAGLILVIVAVLVLGKSDLFVIKKIDITASNVSCANNDQLKSALGILGQNSLFANFNNVEKNIKSKFVCIKSIELSLFFPDGAGVRTIGRQPVASLATLKSPEATTSAFPETIATPSAGQSQENYLMDEEGIVFSKDTGGIDIPNIYFYSNNLFLGKKAGENIENVLKILDKVKIFRLETETSIIWNNYLMIFSYPKLIFQLDDKVDTQLASLQLILDKAKIDLKELAFIDLRFDKPIIRFAPKK